MSVVHKNEITAIKKAQEPWKGEPTDSLIVSLITTYVFLRGRNRKTNLTGFNSSKQFYLPRFFTFKGQIPVLEPAAGKKVHDQHSRVL